MKTAEDGRVLDEQFSSCHAPLATPPQLDELALKRLSASVRHAAEAVERDRAHELKCLYFSVRAGVALSGLCSLSRHVSRARPVRRCLTRDTGDMRRTWPSFFFLHCRGQATGLPHAPTKRRAVRLTDTSKVSAMASALLLRQLL